MLDEYERCLVEEIMEEADALRAMMTDSVTSFKAERLFVLARKLKGLNDPPPPPPNDLGCF